MKHLADNAQVDPDLTTVRLTKAQAREIETCFEKKSREIKLPVHHHDKPLPNKICLDNLKLGL